MGQFIHNNNTITIIDGSGNQSVYDATWWIANEEPAYALPLTATLQYYRQGEIHAWHTPTGVVTGTLPWADGDTYISKKATYDHDLELTKTLSRLKQEKIGEVELYGSTKKNGHVVISGYTYFSDSQTLSKLSYEFDKYTRTTSLPIGYYVNDINYSQISIGILGDVSQLIDSITELHYLCDLNIDAHRLTINALSDKEDVLAYDYSAGWPVVPYDPNLTFHASYGSSIDADYAAGSVTGTAVGGAAIAAGWLDLSHDDVRYVDYSATDNADAQQTGTLSFTVKPNYSGTPSSTTDQVFITASKADLDYTNRIEIMHSSVTGEIFLTINDSTGTVITNSPLAVWSPVAGTEYKFVLNYDIDTGDTKLFIDDIQLGATVTATGTRDSSIGLLRIGCTFDSVAPTNSNFKIKDLDVWQI